MKISTEPRGLLKTAPLLGILLMVALLLAGCSDDPITTPPAAFDTRGVVLLVANSERVLVDTNSAVTGSVSVSEGARSDTLNVLFIAKDGSRSVPTGSDYSLAVSLANGATASIETTGPWSFRVLGKAAGATSMTVKLMNKGAVAYTSKPIPVTVTSSAALGAGDTLTYHFYDRDDANVKDEGSKKIKRWHVLRTDLSIYGKSNVTEILQVRFDATGTAEVDRDTVYLQIDTDGSIYQYDVLRDLLGRIQGAADVFGSVVPSLWVKVTNVNQTGAGTWSAIGSDSITIQNVSVPGIPLPVNITFRMVASHRGSQAATVPAGVYTDAVHTDHILYVTAKLSGGLPLPVLNDSVATTYDASAKVGILRTVLNSAVLVAGAAGQTQELPVAGFEDELVVVAR